MPETATGSFGLHHQFESYEQQQEASFLGMWLFLVTEVLFFGGLFTAYVIYRSAHPRAFALARRVHAHQRRKGGRPYIVHPLAVASACAEHMMDDVSVAAAILHDCIEDAEHELTEEVLANEVGPEVAGIVEGLTKLSREDVPSSDPKEETLKKFPRGNIELSMMRALAVWEWITKDGQVRESRVGVCGYGPHRPRVPNRTDQDRLQNRRVEIRVAEDGAD